VQQDPSYLQLFGKSVPAHLVPYTHHHDHTHEDGCDHTHAHDHQHDHDTHKHGDVEADSGERP